MLDGRGFSWIFLLRLRKGMKVLKTIIKQVILFFIEILGALEETM